MALERAVALRAAGLRRGGGAGGRAGDVEADLEGVRVLRGGDGAGDCTEEAETKVSSDEAVSRLVTRALRGVVGRPREMVDAEGAGEVDLLVPRGFGGGGGCGLLAGCDASLAPLDCAETCRAARRAASTLGLGFSWGLRLGVGFAVDSSLVPTGVFALGLGVLGLTGSPSTPPPLPIGVPPSVPSNMEIKLVVSRIGPVSAASARTGLTVRPVALAAKFAAINESAVLAGLSLREPTETSDLAGEPCRPRGPVPWGVSRMGLGSRLGAVEVPGVRRLSVRPLGEWPLWKARRAPWRAGAGGFVIEGSGTAAISSRGQDGREA